MGVFDKLKSAGQAMTGGSAKVSIEYPLQTVFPGEPVAVRVTVMSSASGEVKSKGVFVDLLAEEHLNGGNMQCPHCRNSFSPKHDPKKTHEQSVPIAPALPCRIAVSAEGRSLAAPQARPEWTPAAAYRSGYVAPMMAAAAPPADRPAT